MKLKENHVLVLFTWAATMCGVGLAGFVLYYIDNIDPTPLFGFYLFSGIVALLLLACVEIDYSKKP